MADESTKEYTAPPKDPKPGPFLAKVVSNFDPTYMGILEVEILKPVGGSPSEGQLHQVKYMSPFYGVTNVAYNGQNNDYNDTQKSYGMWMVPPDLGVTVVVIFIDGDPRRGYWIGCVPDDNMNFMMPGIAATQSLVNAVEKDASSNAGRAPAAEYNKAISANNNPKDPEALQKPTHPLYDVLKSQGLILDDIRGITSSSARRESPSNVFGFSTPGPLDKRTDAKKFKIGKDEWLADTFVSRLGGSSFVMDDGDANWLRKSSPGNIDNGSTVGGPPEYASIDAGDTDGDVTRPANELIRLRTRTGHQILLHNTEDLIYISNSRGTAWIELTSDGKMDVFAQDSISMHTRNDFNFYADRDINMECGRNFSLKVGGRHYTEIGQNKILLVGENNKVKIKGKQDKTIDGATKITIKDKLSINVTGDTLLTTSAKFQLNSGADNNFTAGGGTNFNSAGDMLIKAANTGIDGGNINLNSGVASGAAKADKALKASPPVPLTPYDLPTPDRSSVPAGAGPTINTIALRVPTIEPYPGHENLNPAGFTPENTNREAFSTDLNIVDFTDANDNSGNFVGSDGNLYSYSDDTGLYTSLGKASADQLKTAGVTAAIIKDTLTEEKDAAASDPVENNNAEILQSSDIAAAEKADADASAAETKASESAAAAENSTSSATSALNSATSSATSALNSATSSATSALNSATSSATSALNSATSALNSATSAAAAASAELVAAGQAGIGAPLINQIATNATTLANSIKGK